jgi:hypothetical protein
MSRQSANRLRGSLDSFAVGSVRNRRQIPVN